MNVVAMDRIAEPWGTRTPYGPGTQWPQRVDEYLAEGISPQSVDRWVQSAAVLHSNGDGLDIAVKDGCIVGVRGRAIDRVNHGCSTRRICSAGRRTHHRIGSPPR
mgnify:CR=1 FL=1